MKKLLSLVGIAAVAGGVGYALKQDQKHAPASPWTEPPGSSDDLAVAEDLLDDEDTDLDDAGVEPDLGPVDTPVQDLVDDADRATGEKHKP